MCVYISDREKERTDASFLLCGVVRFVFVRAREREIV